MPVYGRVDVLGGKIPIEYVQLMQITPQEGQRIVFDETGGRRLENVMKWGFVSSGLGPDYMIPVEDTIDGIIASGVKKPLVIDWGCGTGRTITQVAERKPQAECIGYSDEYYPQFKDSDKVCFIYEPTGELHKFLKDGSVDLIFSRVALMHLDKYDNKNFMKEVDSLIPKLKAGGRIIMDFMMKDTFEKLENRSDIELTTPNRMGNRFALVTITRK
jgi:SAM-dependent methyltransferase